jgi:hypothetical protein
MVINIQEVFDKLESIKEQLIPKIILEKYSPKN